MAKNNSNKNKELVVSKIVSGDVLCNKIYTIRGRKVMLDYDLAEIYGYSAQTLIVNFKKHYGKTPMKYITDLRISKAKELLLNTTASVAQVAEMCGYVNVYYFSNTFKKETGISPLKFRQGYLL